MSTTYRYKQGTVTVAGDGLQLYRDWGRIRSIFVLRNGMIACFDEQGQQIPEVQGPLHELLDQFLERGGMVREEA